MHLKRRAIHSAHIAYYVYYVYICRIESIKLNDMKSIVIKKRKNIDLPVAALQKLSIMAASQGESLKAFIERLLIEKAENLKIEVLTNPSPSGDEWFDDPKNLAEIESRIQAYKEGKTEVTVTLRSTEEIKDFISNL